MNNNYKIIMALPFILGALTGCNNDSEDPSTSTSNNYITTEYVEQEITEAAEEENSTATKQLLNEDFENWTDGVPDNWPTIEEGITVEKSTDTFHLGLASAAVTVNTGTQGITDFRQSIDVASGATYTFSAWVYHTEGALKVTLYVDGYPNQYSDFNLVNEWQEITYSYTANEDKSIEVGFRFYDETGFDGEEIVYIDDLAFIEGSIEVVEEESSEVIEEAEATVTKQFLNEDFESWTDGLPDDWTTIDTGITVTQNLSIYHQGASSAEVSVNTGSQGDTDIRQSIDVVAGQTYTFTSWVYHTDGFLQARPYIGGNYPGYSDNTLLNQWQELTYSYTATETTSIEIGIRFYDQEGFTTSEIVYIDNLSFAVDVSAYYSTAEGLTGLALKTALYDIIKDHTTKTYGDIWDFISENTLDVYYENDGSILDMYSENPSSSETYNYTAIIDQCGNFSGEGSCYNREHSFPKSWFDDATPMYTDIHHIFATDGYVNGRRSNYPYGEVGTSTFVSDNGSKLGSATSSLGYTGTVFEPIDEFKGDFARAYFYMATRYQDVISTWESNSDNADAVLDGTSDYVYEEWVIDMLKTWNENDPVSQKELDRNEAAYQFQGNRNPFIDHPEYVNEIWAD